MSAVISLCLSTLMFRLLTWCTMRLDSCQSPTKSKSFLSKWLAQTPLTCSSIQMMIHSSGIEPFTASRWSMVSCSFCATSTFAVNSSTITNGLSKKLPASRSLIQMQPKQGKIPQKSQKINSKKAQLESCLLTRIFLQLLKAWLCQWMKSSCTDMCVANLCTRLKATNNWTGALLVSCFSRQMTWWDS